MLVFVFNFDLFKFSAAILEMGLLVPVASFKGKYSFEERGNGGH